MPSTSFAKIKNGLVFSYNNGFQTQMLFDFSSKYYLKPGVVFTHDLSNNILKIIVDNDFKIGDFNKVSSFWGLGLGYSYNFVIKRPTSMYTFIDTLHYNNFSIEPNYSLEYHVCDQFSFYGSVKISCNYNQIDNIVFYLGKTSLGIILTK